MLDGFPEQGRAEEIRSLGTDPKAPQCLRDSWGDHKEGGERVQTRRKKSEECDFPEVSEPGVSRIKEPASLGASGREFQLRGLV